MQAAVIVLRKELVKSRIRKPKKNIKLSAARTIFKPLGASLRTTHKQMETRNHFKTGRHRKAKRVGLKKQQK